MRMVKYGEVLPHDRVSDVNQKRSSSGHCLLNFNIIVKYILLVLKFILNIKILNFTASIYYIMHHTVTRIYLGFSAL